MTEPKTETLVSEDVCPGCGGLVAGPTCHFTYSTWHCWGCGATLDGRVIVPSTRYRRGDRVLSDDEVSALTLREMLTARSSRD